MLCIHLHLNLSNQKQKNLKKEKTTYLFICLFICNICINSPLCQSLMCDRSVWTTTRSGNKHRRSLRATGPQTGVWWRESRSGLLFTSFFSFHKERVGNQWWGLCKTLNPHADTKQTVYFQRKPSPALVPWLIQIIKRLAMEDLSALLLLL